MHYTTPLQGTNGVRNITKSNIFPAVFSQRRWIDCRRCDGSDWFVVHWHECYVCCSLSSLLLTWIIIHPTHPMSILLQHRVTTSYVILSESFALVSFFLCSCHSLHYSSFWHQDRLESVWLIYYFQCYLAVSFCLYQCITFFFVYVHIFPATLLYILFGVCCCCCCCCFYSWNNSKLTLAQQRIGIVKWSSSFQIL